MTYALTRTRENADSIAALRHVILEGTAQRLRLSYYGGTIVELYVGLGLMALGIVLFFCRSRSKTVRVEASSGSVAVGGKNAGSITNLNVGGAPAAAHGSHALTYASIVVELVGIAVVLWHAWHMAAK